MIKDAGSVGRDVGGARTEYVRGGRPGVSRLDAVFFGSRRVR